MEKDEKLGRLSRFTCPECHGTLWEVDDGTLLRYRCHVGHAFTAEVMMQAQTSGAEEMLWSLMRAHRERAALARRMAEQARAQSRESLADDLEQRASGYEEDAAVIHGMLRAHLGLETSEQDAA